MVVRVLKCCRRLGRLHLGRSHDGGSGRKNDGHSSSGPREGGRPAKIVEFFWSYDTLTLKVKTATGNLYITR